MYRRIDPEHLLRLWRADNAIEEREGRKTGLTGSPG
jgi:hypothetical protein